MFLALPNELLLHVASYLIDPIDLKNLLQTNTHLFHLLTPLLQHHAIQDKTHMPALHWAVQRSHIPLTCLVLKIGLDNIDYQNYTGWTALHHAAAGGRLQLVQLLLERGADVNLKDELGETALHKAVRNAIEDEFKTHFQENVWLYNKDQTQSRFAWAGLETHKEIIQLLLSKGANATACSSSGLTPLHWAVRCRSKPLVRLLLEYGASVTGEDQTPLHWACRYAGEKIVGMLLGKGADISARSELGGTPLHWAVMRAPLELGMVKVLLKRKADVNAFDVLYGTPLHCAVAYGGAGAEGLVRVLLENRVDVNKTLRHGETALHMAVFRGSKGVIRALLENGADMYAEDVMEKMPFEYVMQMGPSKKRDQIVRLFAKRCVQVQQAGITPAVRLKDFLVRYFGGEGEEFWG